MYLSYLRGKCSVKVQNVSLKERVDCTTFAMSDFNNKLKLIEEEKQSLVKNSESCIKNSAS